MDNQIQGDRVINQIMGDGLSKRDIEIKGDGMIKIDNQIKGDGLSKKDIQIKRDGLSKKDIQIKRDGLSKRASEINGDGLSKKDDLKKGAGDNHFKNANIKRRVLCLKDFISKDSHIKKSKEKLKLRGGMIKVKHQFRLINSIKMYIILG